MCLSRSARGAYLHVVHMSRTEHPYGVYVYLYTYISVRPVMPPDGRPSGAKINKEQTNKEIHIHVCVYIYIYIYVCIYIHTYVYMRIHIYLYIYNIHTCVCIYIYIYIHTHVCTVTCLYISIQFMWMLYIHSCVSTTFRMDAPSNHA